MNDDLDVKTLTMTKQEMQERQDECYFTYFPTKLPFLKAHNGYRPGKLHLVIGATHGGKSTLVRSLLKDIYESGSCVENVFLWQTEETEESTKTEFAKTGLSETNLDNLSVEYELELDHDLPNKGLDLLLARIKYIKPQILIIDNITTSRFYMDKKPDYQSEFISKLKKFVQRYGIATVVVAHSGKEINNNHKSLLQINDIRGCKSINNLAEFCYIIQAFDVQKATLNIIRIVKHRLYNVKNKLYWLDYDEETHTFDDAHPAEFDQVKEILKKLDEI